MTLDSRKVAMVPAYFQTTPLLLDYCYSSTIRFDHLITKQQTVISLSHFQMCEGLTLKADVNVVFWSLNEMNLK